MYVVVGRFVQTLYYNGATIFLIIIVVSFNFNHVTHTESYNSSQRLYTDLFAVRGHQVEATGGDI